MLKSFANMASRAATAWAAIILFVKLSGAAPSISFPINSQVPPVARIGQPFSFIFSPSTFSSPSPITYSLANPPPWLSVDSAARRLFGTPSEADVGPGQVVGVPVALVATDPSGSATLDATLVVSRSPGPRVHLPFERQVPHFGVFSGPSSVLTSPQTEFTFDLAADTFLDPSGSPLSYYAVMADNTPLPAWIAFDAAGLTFSGKTPPSESLIQPPQRFAFQIVASDVVGFAAASLRFDIVVGSEAMPTGGAVNDKHSLTADQTSVLLVATAGTSISYTGLRGIVRVDGKPATAENAAIVATPNIPSWLSVDKDSWHMSGVPPETAEPTNFTIAIQDRHSNTLDLEVRVDVTGKTPRPASLFKGRIPPLTAAAGELFSADLTQHLENPSDTETLVSSDSSPPWVTYDAKALRISGRVPNDVQDTTFNIPIQAKSKSSGKTDSIYLTVRILAEAEATNKVSSISAPTTQLSTPTAEATAFATDNPLVAASDDYASEPPNFILLAVLLPAFIVIGSVICLLFWWFRRRKEETRPRLTTRDISGPLPHTFVKNGSGHFVHGSGQGLDAKGGSRGHQDSPYSGDSEPRVSEQKEYIVSRATYMSNASAPKPHATVRLLPPIDTSPSDADDVFGTGTVPLLPPIKPLRLTRHDLRNDRSLSSISETSVYEDNGAPLSAPRSNNPTDGLLGPKNGAGTPFRDTVEVHIPTFKHDVSSITHTPESAYTAPRSSPLSVGSARSPTSSAQALRAQSRLGQHPVVASASNRKFAWPWLKKTVHEAKAAVVGRQHARKFSVATVDTFAYKRPTPTASPPAQEDPSPPRLARLPVQDVGGSVRPVTRRGPAPGQTWGSGISRTLTDAALPSSPTMGYATLPALRQPQQRHQPADSLGIMETPGRNTNDNYEDLVSGGPFQASKTWSTLGGDEWCDETVLSQSAASFSQPNWRRAEEEAGPTVGEASPVVGNGLYLSGSKELGSELGSVLLSPDRWPRADAHGKGKGKVGAATGANGLGNPSLSQGLSLASEGSPRFL